MEAWFANPLLLWLGLLAGPVVALFMLRHKPIVKRVPSTLLWAGAAQLSVATSPFSRLRKSLSLLLMLLLLLCLVLALAGLRIPDARLRGLPLVVIIDCSAGMQTQTPDGTRLDVAISRAQDVINAASDSPITLLTWNGALLLAAPADHYLDPESPVQRAIRDAVGYACGADDPAAMPSGTDGCSAPNFAVPLVGLARAFAWMTRDEADPRYGTAPKTLFEAMAAHPEMVSGAGRNDLALATAGRGDWANKVGADGVQTLASRSRGIGIAAKVSDGNLKALMVAFCSVLEQLGMLDDTAKAALESWSRVPIKSIRGIEVGAIEPHVLLKRTA